MIVRELTPIFENTKSYYGKAKVIILSDRVQLQSYNTIVAEINDDTHKVTVFGDYSATTLRHIKEFLKQSGEKAETKKQILNDYLK